MTLEEKAWLVVRAIGLNILVFGCIEAVYVMEYGLRLILLAPSASTLYRWLFTWATIRFAAHLLIGMYLMFGGRRVHRLVTSVLAVVT